MPDNLSVSSFEMKIESRKDFIEKKGIEQVEFLNQTKQLVEKRAVK